MRQNGDAKKWKDGKLEWRGRMLNCCCPAVTTRCSDVGHRTLRRQQCLRKPAVRNVRTRAAHWQEWDHRMLV